MKCCHDQAEEELLDEPNDSFTKLLAELSLEIEEEADIGFKDALKVVPLDCENGSHHLHCPSSVKWEIAVLPLCDEYDVRTDHPTSMLGEEEIPPTTFSDQEVPENEAELELEADTLGTSLPATDDVASVEHEGRGENLYSNIATPTSERALAVDNEDIQRFLNLGEIFSFHDIEKDEEEIFPVSSGVTTGNSNDGTTGQGASSHTVAQDIINQVMTDETFPVYDDADVADALSHNGNEFIPTSEREMLTLHTGGECLQLGRGDYSSTCKDRKENSEEKIYFHPVRLPCHDASKDAPLSSKSRLSSSPQQEAASPHSERCAAR